MPRRLSLSRSSQRHNIVEPPPPSIPTNSFATAWSTTQGHKHAISTPAPSPPVSAQTQNSTGWRRRSGSSVSASALSRTGSSSLYTTSTTTTTTDPTSCRERGSRTSLSGGLGMRGPRRLSITLHAPRHEIIRPPSDPIPQRSPTPELLLDFDFDFEPSSSGTGSGGDGSGVKRRESVRERWTRFRMWWKMGVLRIRRRVERGGVGSLV